MSDASPRFQYPFEFLLLRQSWRLDAALLALAAAASQRQRLSDEIDRMHQDCAALNRPPIGPVRIDPELARARLDQLHQQRMAVVAQRQRLDDLDRQQLKLRLECGSEQARLDGLKGHRDQRRMAFDAEHARKATALRDQEELARWSQGSMGAGS